MRSSPATPPDFAPGTVIAGRFVIEQPAVRGGMGAVFRAKDRLDGRDIALKFMHASADTGAALRFVREAEVLAELQHPGIVTHVAHGRTDNGQLFLAMEWLEGESLEQRLAREPLSPAEAQLLLRRVAEALAIAHGRGIIHRDLKPSNLFLRQRRVEEAAVLDFGLARHVLVSQVVTGSAMVLGTPGYMAPEQASSQKELTPSADIFSLGCVLFECLTGQQPFRAPNLAAALDKILFAEPPPLRELRPGLPPRLQLLLDQMLAKDPKRRPPDAAGLLRLMDGLERAPDMVTLEVAAGDGGLGVAVQWLVSVLLVRPRNVAVEEPSPRPPLEQSTVRAPRDELLGHLRTAFSNHGAKAALLADGCLLLTLLPEKGAATDQAALAARCALFIKERWPESVLVLCTGRGLLDQQRPVGEVMDRAGQLLRQQEQAPAPTTAVLLDEVTAGLLGPGFQLDRLDTGSFLLHGEQPDADASRLLLGRPTPCVGRERELSMLELTFGTCVEDESARAVLVTAPAGAGKSRLRHEFLRRLEKQGQEVLLLLGRGDPMRTGSAYALLGEAVRRLCGIKAGEELETKREMLRQRVGRHLPPTEAPGVIAFLGELCGLPFPDEASPRLRAARADPRVMSDQVGRAFVAFLLAESTRSPVLLVLEDLHWADASTVQLVDETLRALRERPLLVLALARPEVKEQFPSAWGAYLQELALRGLTRNAGSRLAREVLGPDVPGSVIERVVEQAAGNALYLEELIRMVAEGKGEAPPATVLAMLQARIRRLEGRATWLLLAASFFGRSFWAGGVKAMLSQVDEAYELERWLRQLVDLEVVEQQPVSRFPSDTEYRFRPPLLRDAAYGMVPDRYKAWGHRLVGTWLEQAGEPDPLVLAEHYQRGQEKERAIPFYVRAAEQLAERDWRAALRCVEAGVACGASGERLTQLRALEATLASYRQQED